MWPSYNIWTLPFWSLLLLGQPFTLKRNNPVIIIIPISIRILKLHFCINLLLISNHITIVLYPMPQLVIYFTIIIHMHLYKNHWFLIIGTFKHFYHKIESIFFYFVSLVLWRRSCAWIGVLGWNPWSFMQSLNFILIEFFAANLFAFSAISIMVEAQYLNLDKN